MPVPGQVRDGASQALRGAIKQRRDLVGSWFRGEGLRGEGHAREDIEDAGHEERLEAEQARERGMSIIQTCWTKRAVTVDAPSGRSSALAVPLG